MRAGTLPSRIEQINNNIATSISELRTYSMAVIASSRNDPHPEQQVSQNQEFTTSIDWTDSFKPIFSIRPKESYFGKDNRIVAIPTSLKIYCEDASCAFQIIKWPVLTGDTWTFPTSSYSSLQADNTAVSASLGGLQTTQIVPLNTLLSLDFDTSWDAALKIHRLADITSNNCPWTVMGKLLNNKAPGSASVSLVFNWKEIF